MVVVIFGGCWGFCCSLHFPKLHLRVVYFFFRGWGIRYFHILRKPATSIEKLSFELSQDAGCFDNIGTTALRITRPLNCITNLGKMDQVINTRTSKLRCILDWWLQLSHSPVIFFIDNALKIPKFVLLSHVFLHIHNQALDGGEISRICHFSHCGCLVTHCPL